MTKRNKVALIGTVAFMLVLVIYATYAYLNPIMNINNMDIGADISGPLTFTATGGDDLSLKVTESAMAEGDVGSVVAEGSDTMTITLETDGLEGICCSYDIIWEWDKTDNSKNQYHKSEGATNEYVFSASLNETYKIGNQTNSVSHTNPVLSRQVPDYNNAKLSSSIYKTSICNNTKELTTKAQQVYTLDTKVYNLDVPQDNLRGAKLASRVRVDNVSCRKSIALSDAVLAKVDDADYVSSQDGSEYVVKQENVTYNSKTLDAGVRYEGKNPDNYITFNNEEWRIIGVFDGKDIGLTEGSKYTKIVRNNIGTSGWNNYAGRYENDWANSSLKNYLNNDYLETIGDSNMVAPAVWYVRGTSTASLNSKDMYIVERITGQTGAYNGTLNAAVSEIKAAVGLMYPSDYGYAAYGDGCDNSVLLNNYSAGCVDVDWLSEEFVNVNKREWLITPNASKLDWSYNMGVNGNVNASQHTDNRFIVRPTLYLKEDVTITGGTGSQENPYQITYKAPTLSEEVISKNSDSDYTSSQDGTIYKVVHEEVKYNGKTYDAGVRYEGKNPDNYVTFNGDEEWRIIGTFEGSTIGLEPGKQYTKIISNELIYKIWDEDNGNEEYENDWSNSTLYNYLNGEYLSLLSDANKIARYNENYSTWYLRGMTINEHEADGITKNWYIAERITGTPGYKNRVKGAAAATTTGAIGLMYPSDYGFAAYGATCDIASSKLYEWECIEVDWLSPTYTREWLISPVPDGYENAYYLYGDGIVDTSGPIPGDYAVRPTLYLEADIEVAGGTGSKEHPYELAAPERNLSEVVINSVSDNEYTSSQDGTKYVITREEVEYEGTTYDAGVRFEGKDPDNYVTFNGNEEWRIIGVFEGSTIGLEPGKQYTKIIRSNSIGNNISWNENKTNDWVNSTLNAYLNNEYLNSLTTSDKIATYNDNYSTWYLRGMDSDQNLTSTIKDWYLTEKITGKPGSTTTSLIINDAAAEAPGAIGLMYPSDYGYAAYGADCDKTSATLSRFGTLEDWDTMEISGCAGVDWLLGNDWDFTITIDSEREKGPSGRLMFYFIDWDTGGRVGAAEVGAGYAIRPTLYLESDVMITGGTGTKLDPYIIN